MCTLPHILIDSRKYLLISGVPKHTKIISILITKQTFYENLEKSPSSGAEVGGILEGYLTDVVKIFMAGSD